MLYQKELETALNAVGKASMLCQDAQKDFVNPGTVEKQDRSPVTIADFGSQAVINLALIKAFPNDPVIGEEDSAILKENKELCQKVMNLVRKQSGDVSETQVLEAIDAEPIDKDFTRRFWTVDPIDGTKGFLRGEQYAVALALVENGRPVLGVLGCPNFPADNGKKGCILYGLKGQGSFMYSSDALKSFDTIEKKISVARDSSAENARFCESFEKAHASHDVHAQICKIVGIKASPFRMDSQAKYAAVASGKASVYLRLPRVKGYKEKIWDHAAGVIIVEEAGGRVTDFNGSALDFSAGISLLNNTGILATNSHLHEDVLKAIKIIREQKK